MQADRLDANQTVWTPPAGAFETSPVGRFAHRHGIDDLANLAARAEADPMWFWGAVVEDLGVEWTRPFDAVLDLSDGPEWPHFFAGGQLNIADNAVDRWVRQGAGERAALRWVRDGAPVEVISYEDLAGRVARCASGLRSIGIGKGDAVAILLPMCPEAAVSLLALARIGAIAVPMFSGYGSGAVRERLVDADARAVVTIDGYERRGKRAELLRVVREACDGLGMVNRRVVVRRDASTPLDPDELDWDDLCSGDAADGGAVACSSEDPLLILYTSGSTGRPKGCVHTHGGLPIKVAQEARHGMGVDQGSTVLWVTDMGWVMGPWLVLASLLNGATAVLFEGVPDWPGPDRLWQVVAENRVSVLGISPTAIRVLMAHGDEHPRAHDLTSLRAIGSTGEPWNPEPWMWCFDAVGGRQVPIVNICGGTECGGSILSGSIVAPLKPCSFSGPALGMAADVVAPSGRSTLQAVGELVVRFPWPGMTQGFWRDRARYLESYWERWPGVWHHGDLAYVDADGSWYILGRSDDTIKVAGKRLGPAEVESTLVRDPDVVEAAAVGLPHDTKGEVLGCFVVLKDGRKLTDVEARLMERIRDEFGPALRPDRVHAVSALPKTRNGKVMRRVVRAAFLGHDCGDLSALDDPRALEELRLLAVDPRSRPADVADLLDSTLAPHR